jgi:hypothetical protein
MPNYQPKKLKFYGEEKFMCQKKNTRKRYLMATAESNIGKLQEAIDVVPLEQATVINPSVVPTDATSTTMTPPVLISVPNWEAMDCKTILIEIQSIQDMLMTSKFSQDVINQYNQIIADGKATYTRKCEVVSLEPTPHAPPQLEVPEPTPTPTPTPTPVSTTTITTTGVPIIQSTGTTGGLIKPPMGGGGSGGGGGATPKPTEKKPNWLLIALLVGGAYLLFRKK